MKRKKCPDIAKCDIYILSLKCNCMPYIFLCIFVKKKHLFRQHMNKINNEILFFL